MDQRGSARDHAGLAVLTDTASPSHFEVVDQDDQLVGGMKHRTSAQAGALRDALVKAGFNGVLGVAEVTERVVVERKVSRVQVAALDVRRATKGC